MSRPKLRDPYIAYLLPVDGFDGEQYTIGNFANLSKALVAARVACQEAGIREWDWFVDKRADDYSIINRRSSLAGFES